MDPVRPGQAVGSDTGHMAILGYDPFECYTGRGPFEAKGVGIDVQPGDLAFRCNFTAVEGNTVTDRRAGRISEETDKLAAAVNDAFRGGIDGIQVIFKESVAHRAALVLRGEGLDPRVTDVDPHEAGAEVPLCQPLPDAADDPAARRTADVVNQFVARVREVLEHHEVNERRRAAGLLPANIVLPRGVGTAPHLRPFAEQHGLGGAMIVEVDLVRGLGEYLGMDVINVPGATGGMDTDEIAIVRAVVEAAADHGFILANIKAPDLGGHDGEPDQKMEAIAKVDRAVGHLLKELDWDKTVMMIAADHCTPCTAMDHTGDAIPIVFYGHGVRPDGVATYGERPCAAGSIHRIRGCDVMSILGNYAGTLPKFGA
jgi:2,3-bisphosphoglycerate-independent phosphoglycerate mutase